jgi:hypothetical protein
LPRKSQAKNKSLPTLKASTRLPPLLKPGFVRAHSPCWLENRQRKLSSDGLRNHQRHCFDSYRVDSSSHKVHVDSKSQAKTESLPTQKPSTRLPPQLKPWFVCAHSPCWLGKRHRKLSSCRLRNPQQQCFQVLRVDSSGHKVAVASEIASEKWVAANSEGINDTASTAEA